MVKRNFADEFKLKAYKQITSGSNQSRDLVAYGQEIKQTVKQWTGLVRLHLDVRK